MARSELASVAAATEARATGTGEMPSRVVRARPGAPGRRAVLGGLLMAVAAIGVFVAYAGASSDPAHDFVVADRDLDVGETLTPDDLRVAEGDLPDGTRGNTFAATDAVVGRVVLVPIAADDIVQASAVTDGGAEARGHEVQLTLPRDQVAVGRLKRGERVDVFVTHDEETTLVASGVPVVSISTGKEGSLTSEREVGIVVSAPTREVVTALIHAQRTGEVTVVRAPTG